MELFVFYPYGWYVVQCAIKFSHISNNRSNPNLVCKKIKKEFYMYCDITVISDIGLMLNKKEIKHEK